MESPDHRAARANWQRVKQAVEEIDSASLHRIDHKRDTVATIPDSNPALRRAKKEAYFQVTTQRLSTCKMYTQFSKC